MIKNIPGTAIPILDSAGNGLDLVDLDENNGVQILTIDVADGELSIAEELTGLEITGNNSNQLTLKGNSELLSQALKKLSYLPRFGVSGDIDFTITATDMLSNSTERLGLSTTSVVTVTHLNLN